MIRSDYHLRYKLTKIRLKDGWGRKEARDNFERARGILLNLSLMQVDEIFISLGSNTGARALMLQEALKEIALLPALNVLALSGIYETASWGVQDQPLYLNQVIRVSTSLEPSELMQNLLRIEHKLGRIRSGERWLSRTIDLDILFFGSLILQTPVLQLPHPRLGERRFVLVPLAEIGPLFRDPLTHKSVLELLRDCQDPLSVNLWPLSNSSEKV